MSSSFLSARNLAETTAPGFNKPLVAAVKAI
jgi:hypothetical protein